MIPDKGFVNAIYKHDLKHLIGIAGLTAELKQEQDNNPQFAVNWALAAQWNEESRYETKDSMTAQITFEAIADQKSGVLQWIKNYW